MELNINGIVSNNNVEIANEFNSFFIKSAEELAANTGPVKLEDIPSELSMSFHIKEVNYNEIG